jgi:hypothetical protein
LALPTIGKLSIGDLIFSQFPIRRTKATELDALILEGNVQGIALN